MAIRMEIEQFAEKFILEANKIKELYIHLLPEITHYFLFFRKLSASCMNTLKVKSTEAIV